MIPAMTELLGPDQHLYQAAAMIMNFFVVVPAVFQHRRAGAIDSATVVRLVPLAVVAVVVGVGVSELRIFAGVGEVYLRGLFGLFLFFVAGCELYRLFRPRDPRPGAADVAGATGATMGWGHASLVAIPTGLVAGLLGIGGGVLAVPLQRRFLRVPMRVAIANSATVIIATSLIGSGVKNYAYLTEHEYSAEPIRLAAVLIPTAIIGSLIGSRLTHQLPIRFVKAAFFVLLALAAARFTYQAAVSLSRPDDLNAAGEPARIALKRAAHASAPLGRCERGSTSRTPPTDTHIGPEHGFTRWL